MEDIPEENSLEKIFIAPARFVIAYFIAMYVNRKPEMDLDEWSRLCEIGAYFVIPLSLLFWVTVVLFFIRGVR